VIAAFANAIGQGFSAGIVTELADGVLEIHSAPGRYIAWLVVFAVVMPVAGWCWRRGWGGNIAPGAFIVSFFIPLILVPGMATESIRVAPDRLSVRTGFWFAPTRYTISLTDAEAVVETVETVVQRRGPIRHEIYWQFRYHSRRPYRLDLPDLLEANREPVAEYLRRHRMAVIQG
jgi:hypothetical protein